MKFLYILICSWLLVGLAVEGNEIYKKGKLTQGDLLRIPLAACGGLWAFAEHFKSNEVLWEKDQP